MWNINIYIKLQLIITSCIDLWWQYLCIWKKYKNILEFKGKWIFRYWVLIVSYNDLFSKNSWIIDFLDWNLKHEESITITEHGWFKYDIKNKADIVYMIMWNMTEKNKINIFFCLKYWI